MPTPMNSTKRIKSSHAMDILRAFIVAQSLLVMSVPAGAASVPAYDDVQNALALVLSSQGSGTAFCIKSNDHESVLITNRHVVGTDTNVQLIIQGTTNRNLYARVARVGTGSLDAAVLVVDFPNIPHLNLSNTPPDPGTAIGVAGYPRTQLKFALMRLGLSPSVHAGVVSALVAGGYYLEFDAQVEPGNSGGPLFDADTGLVYGLVTYKVGDREANLAIDAPDLAAFLQNAGASEAYVPTSPAPRETQTALEPAPTPASNASHDTYVPYVDGWHAAFSCSDGSRQTITMRSFPFWGWPSAMQVHYARTETNGRSADSESLEADDGAGNAILLGVFVAKKLVPTTPVVVVPIDPSATFTSTSPFGTIRIYAGEEDFDAGNGQYPKAHTFRDTKADGTPIDDLVFARNVGLVAMFFPSSEAQHHVACLRIQQ